MYGVQHAHKRAVSAAAVGLLLFAPALAFAPSAAAAEGNPLVVNGPSEVRDVQPGAVTGAQFSVKNTGSAAVSGLTLQFQRGDGGLSFVDRFGNCTYATDDTDPYVATCTFDGELAAGEEYELDTPLQIRVAAQTVRTVLTVRAQPSSAAPAAGQRSAEAGKTLKLKAKPGKRAAAAAGSNELKTWYYTPLKADPAVTATGLSGKVGDVVDGSVTVENRGKGDIDIRGMMNEGHDDPRVGEVSVELPKGTEVDKLPSGCAMAQQGVTTRFTCFLPDFRFTAGQQVKFDYRAKLVEKVADAEGHATLDLNTSGVPELDADTANDTAKIAVSWQTGSAAAGSGDSGARPDNGGPELAETGGSSSTPVIAGIGGGLLLVAGGAFVVARRRKAAMPA